MNWHSGLQLISRSGLGQKVIKCWTKTFEKKKASKVSLAKFVPGRQLIKRVLQKPWYYKEPQMDEIHSISFVIQIVTISIDNNCYHSISSQRFLFSLDFWILELKFILHIEIFRHTGLFKNWQKLRGLLHLSRVLLIE